MLITNAGFARATFLFLAVGTTILMGIIFATFAVVERSRSGFEFLVAEREIRRASSDLLQKLVDAESGQRGFLLTQNERFLEPYDEALSELRLTLEELDRLVATKPMMAERMPQMRRLIDSKLDEMARTIALARQGRSVDALALVGTDMGRAAMEDIRAIIAFVKDQSDTNIAKGVEGQIASNQTLQWITLGGALAILAVMGGAVYIVFQHVQALSSTRNEVEALNEGLEQRVNERTEDLIRANQEIQRFAYIVTHDLRAPLVNIMGFTSELDASLRSLQAYVLSDDRQPTEDEVRQARLAASEDLPEAIGFIRSSTQKMDGLINAILKISRDGRRPLKPEAVELEPLLATATASVQHQISESGGTVSIEVQARELVTDRFSLEQILGNLIDNAIKYRHPARHLALSIRTRQTGRHMMQIEVEDNGRGIAPQDHDRIFELFRRAGQQNQPGEGIGLAHVRSLARNLGGDITVRSQMGEGSTFVLRLPIDLSRLVRS